MTDTATQSAPEVGPGAWLEPGHPWEALRAPFRDDEIAYKPQPISKDIKERGTCKAGSKVQHGQNQVPVSRDGIFCGGYHAPSVHLTYVGHAALTERLDAVCGPENWNWEPFAVGADGLPAIKDGSLWIRLTIWGVTKIGVGDHEGQAGPVAHKVMIGDALRNAGMRFGIARYLWDKSEKAREQARQERGDDDDRQALPASRPAQRTNGRAGGDGFELVPLSDAGKEILAAALQTDDLDAVPGLLLRAEGLREMHVTVRDLHPAGPMLMIDRPMTLAAAVERVGQFVRHHGRSVVSAIEAAKDSSGGAEQPTPIGSGDAEAVRDAADAVRGAIRRR